MNDKQGLPIKTTYMLNTECQENVVNFLHGEE